jgi:hypothetical protein
VVSLASLSLFFNAVVFFFCCSASRDVPPYLKRCQNGDGLLTLKEFTQSVAAQKVREQMELRHEATWKRLQLYLDQHGKGGKGRMVTAQHDRTA